MPSRLDLCCCSCQLNCRVCGICVFVCRSEGRPSHRARDSGSLYVPSAKRARSEDDQDRRGGQRSRAEHRDRGRHRPRGRGSSSRGGRARGERDPDYVKNPSKWTKYDLKEDGSQVLRGMSEDQVNKYAAFQFLDQVKKRKTAFSLEHGGETGSGESEEREGKSSAKVVFKKPRSRAAKPGSREGPGSDVRTGDAASSVGAHGGLSGGIKMAEYVVGSKSAAQLQRERRQKKTKLISLQSEEGGAGSQVELDGKVHVSKKEIGRSVGAKSKKTAGAVCLSHLEEEEDT